MRQNTVTVSVILCLLAVYVIAVRQVDGSFSTPPPPPPPPLQQQGMLVHAALIDTCHSPCPLKRLWMHF